ncbi:hypothetical protein BBO99_00008081 [Phytophthora kernoviae]|uniref:Uncharacterized protein n=2 Tax=Phytophthora kernoviae TaxID=325452 RepID=A0A421GG98_9STRA|nr:hypothetical protein G195_009257 [Phytophthora kernoviae 00238/432]KAG2515759.1 hypothetical protein JM16_007723 [Phytophthora kernoviae]KAG2518648.1 hypothetical protein JM18_007643 [Phytophthora kernoviae]RLN21405.1 hypothetical protein BBI17_008012 [Phytophthora kernoviae]RLN75775.1 hypothetical protein BBO99_00008081 [Phytophthora kernoviae]
MITGLWSQDEHAKFLLAIKLYPHGPWRKVAAYVGTRSIRQVQTHAQKYHEKVVRRMRGLHKGRRASGRREHRIDDDMLAACKVGEGFGVIAPFQLRPSPSDGGSQPQQLFPVLNGSELMMSLLLDSAPCPMSPGGVDSDGVVDTDIFVQGLGL